VEIGMFKDPKAVHAEVGLQDVPALLRQLLQIDGCDVVVGGHGALRRLRDA